MLRWEACDVWGGVGVCGFGHERHEEAKPTGAIRYNTIPELSLRVQRPHASANRFTRSAARLNAVERREIASLRSVVGVTEMAWQDVFPVSSPRIDAEEDREMRLALQARAGAEWALTALIARYQPTVTRYLTRLTGNSERARVLAERIFIRMERRIHGPQGAHYLRLWLLRSSTEDGLDVLRKPRRAKSAPQLDSPTRQQALLNAPGVTQRGERLRAGLGAIAGVTGQTSRQVRKLIWGDRDAERRQDDSDLPDFDDAGEEDAEPDAREALRYRMIRAVLAEIPYGDAQCLALHLVAGLNQAEVARALGLTNSATRRRIVQGLEMFSQRYNAAVATLGLSPEMLEAVRSDGQGDPLAPGIDGYIPYQEQPTSAYPSVTVSAEPPKADSELLEPVGAGPTNWLPREDTGAHSPSSFSITSDVVLEGTIVDAVPAGSGATEAHPLILAEPILITADTMPLPPQEESSDGSATPWPEPLAPFDEDEPLSESMAHARPEDDQPTLPRMPALRPPTEATDTAEIAETEIAEEAEVQEMWQAPEAPIVPVLSPPTARERVETMPLPGRLRALRELHKLPSVDPDDVTAHPE